MQNWLAIAAAVYLAAMILMGHYKGFIRMAVSAASLIITLIAVNAVMPQVTSYLKQHTEIYQTIESAIGEAIGMDESADADTPAAQRQKIEGLKLPERLKEGLVANNNHEVYRLLGAETFSRYVMGYLVNNMVNLTVYLLLFGVLFGTLQIISRCLDLVARLPVIYGVNKLAGAALGAAEGLVFLWLFCLLVTAFSTAEWGAELGRLIEESSWLSYLYDHNLLVTLAASLMKGFL